MKSTVSGVAVFASNAISYLFGFLLICHFWIFVSGDNCSDPVYFSDNCIVDNQTEPVPTFCNINEEKWYRFGPGVRWPPEDNSPTEFPESCDTQLQLKHQLPIWIYGRHPNGADNAIKSVKACAPVCRGKEGCYLWKGNISALFCTTGQFYIYQLKKPPVCSMSYCSGDGLPCNKRGCVWNGIQRRCTCPAITEAPVLKTPKVITGTTEVTDKKGRKFFPTKFVVECEVKYRLKKMDDDVEVTFEIDGHYLASFNVNSEKPVATLDEAYLVGNLGKELSCKVPSHWNSSDDGVRYLISNRRWFGLNPVYANGSVISHNLVVKEDEKVSLRLTPTFPITTRPCFNLSLHESCSYTSYLFRVSTAADTVKLSECEIIFNNSNRFAELEIAPIPTVRAKPVFWQLNFEPYHDDANLNSQDTPAHKLPIFKDYRIQSVNIEVRAGDVPPECLSMGDPHIRTFPNAAGTSGNYFSVYDYGVGDFYLVRHRSRMLEIQVHHVRCNLRASCNCGVMAREGNSIIGITLCNRKSPLLIKEELEKHSPTGTIHTKPGGGWQISLLSGIVIEVTIPYVEHLDLRVIGLKSELTQYDGLCSATNVTRNSMCTSDCERYRVLKEKSFFNINPGNLPLCYAPNPVPACTCNTTNPDDTPKGNSIKIACQTPQDNYLLTIHLREKCNRYKRQLGDDDNEEGDGTERGEDSISLEDFNDDTAAVAAPAAPLPQPEVDDRWLNMADRFFGRVRSLTAPSPVLSEEDGRRRCNDALRFSATFEICSSRVDTSAIVKSCALDVEIMNDYGPTKAVPTQFETACLDSIRISLETYASSDSSGFEELKDLLTRVEKLVCPLQCSQNGRCVDSKCQCNEGYMGTDCSLTIGQAPVIHRIIMPVCDIRKHPCTQIHVEASDLTTPEDVVCKMRSVNDVDGAVPAVQTSTPVISGGLVLCKLPQMPVSVKEPENGKSTTVFRVQVSISNDGETYSQELPFTVVDGHCMECPASQDTPCRLKANTCSIGGRCYRAEVSCPQDDTMICNPSTCATRWTGESSTSCDDGFENCT